MLLALVFLVRGSLTLLAYSRNVPRRAENDVAPKLVAPRRARMDAAPRHAAPHRARIRDP